MVPRRRVYLWLGGLILYSVLLVPVGTVLMAIMMVPPWARGSAREVLSVLGDPEFWGWGLGCSAVIAGSQYLFLLPVLRLRAPQGGRPRPLTVSLVVGGLLAALLTVALGLGLVELAAGLITGDLTANPWGGDDLLGKPWVWPGAGVTLVGSWVLWSVLLMVFTRKLWPDKVIGRLALLLFGGTVAELLVVVPIDVMVRRRTSCECATGTFWSLCISAVALLWLAGPGIVFALTSKRRRLARVTHCAACGHAKGPTPGPVCPECGYDWLIGPSGPAAAAGTGRLY